MIGLSRAQAEIFRALYDFITEHGYSPTVRQLCEATYRSSTSTVQLHLRSLARKGFVRFTPRGCTIVNTPIILRSELEA